MKNVFWLGVLLTCSACVHTTGGELADRQYQRIDYFETVFLPTSQACSRAGGFMIFEDPAANSRTAFDLSYAEMRTAVARGCAGI